MTLSRDDFVAFFAAAHNGHSPFQWQERLLDQVLTTGRWPEHISAPTSAGKTALIDVYVFALALATVTSGPRLPRRLALIVDRRFLVDSHYEHARVLAGQLRDAKAGTVLAAVAQALQSLVPAQSNDDASNPMRVVRLRGGLPAPRSWVDDPERCMVLCCTPDMWGSRVLLRGYGASPNARPRAAGLLGLDAVVVIDEAHLSQQLVTTARRIAQLQALAQHQVGVPLLQVVAMTATPTTTEGVHAGVEEADLLHDPALAQRLTAPKPVHVHTVPAWPLPAKGTARSGVLRTYVAGVSRLRSAYGTTVGCVVNRVGTAIAIHEALTQAGMVSVLLCGRMRPFDVDRCRQEHPDLFTPQGDPAVDVVVATQTIEVGLDADFSAMVTDLAPATAIAQRTGRVNRLGVRDKTEVVVIAPDLEHAKTPLTELAAKPYLAADLHEASAWLTARSNDPAGLAPWALRADPPPAATPRRTLYQRVELTDAMQWARTDGEAFADPDLDLWLSDDLDGDHDVGVVLRRDLPAEEADAIDMVRTLMPRAHETYPTTIRRAQELLERLFPEQRSKASPTVIRVRVSAAVPEEKIVVLRTAKRALRPGDVLVLDTSTPCLRADTVDPEGDQYGSDVLEAQTARGTGALILRLDEHTFGSAEPAKVHEGLAAILRTTSELSSESNVAEGTIRAELARGLKQLAGTVTDGDWSERASAVAGILQPAKLSDLYLHKDPDSGTIDRLLIVDRRRVLEDEDQRQTWTTSDVPVPLQQHAENVAARAAELAARLGLPASLVDLQRLAGLHHDDGKRDARFQLMLGGEPGGQLIAKSGGASPRARKRAEQQSSLPIGWRHEQLSAQLAWQATQELPDGDRKLVVRLVGTSHGHGRPSFPHDSFGLLQDAADADTQALFDEGCWDQLVEQTDWAWGVWGCAYLEALLRAANGQVSKEGS